MNSEENVLMALVAFSQLSTRKFSNWWGEVVVFRIGPPTFRCWPLPALLGNAISFSRECERRDQITVPYRPQMIVSRSRSYITKKEGRDSLHASLVLGAVNLNRCPQLCMFLGTYRRKMLQSNPGCPFRKCGKCCCSITDRISGSQNDCKRYLFLARKFGFNFVFIVGTE